MSGAIATIGVTCSSTAYGNKLISIARLCTNTNAMNVPMTIAATKACSVTRSVIQRALSSDGHSLASFRAMSLGLGNRKIGMLALRQTISHRTTITTPTASGARIVIAVSDCTSGRMVRSLATISSSALHLRRDTSVR